MVIPAPAHPGHKQPAEWLWTHVAQAHPDTCPSAHDGHKQPLAHAAAPPQQPHPGGHPAVGCALSWNRRRPVERPLSANEPGAALNGCRASAVVGVAARRGTAAGMNASTADVVKTSSSAANSAALNDFAAGEGEGRVSEAADDAMRFLRCGAHLKPWRGWLGAACC